MIIGVAGKINSGKDTVGQIIKIILDNPHLNNEGILNFIKKEIYNNKKSPYYPSWEIRKFADKLKDMVCLLIGCTREQLEDREFKEKELGEEWDKWIMKEIDSDGHTYSNEKILYFESKESAYSHCTTFPTYEYSEPKIIKLTPRTLLQLLGTECGRQIIHPNVWVNALMSEYKPVDRRTIQDPDDSNISLPNWIITDMRFPNELKAVKNKEGITIRINRSFNHKMGSKEIGTINLTPEHESEKALDNAEFDYVIDNSGTLEDLIDKVREILIKEKLIK